jgi:RND family efflux transporter MFP subunit
MNNKAALLVGALALALVVGWLLMPDWAATGNGDRRDGDRDGQQAVAVETGAVTRANIADYAQYTGTLQPGTQFVLAPKTSGRLRSLLVDIGDPVQRGQVIARLDDEEFVQNVAEQQAALDVAEAQLQDARAQRAVRERSYDRIADLRSRGLASESEYDLARSEFDAADARVRVALAQRAQREAALRAAEVRLSYATVRAEWGGEGEGARFVGERFVDEGANLSANEPIISVIDLDALRAITFITDRDLARLRIGQPVEVRSDALPGRTFEGRVQRIAPLLREDTRQARVEISVPNPDRRLNPGFFVRLEIEIEQLENALVVPEDALTRLDGQRGVFVVGDQTENGWPVVHWVPVTVGVRSDGFAQILEPEIWGRVVTLGQHRLSDGARIRVPENEHGRD